MPSLLAISRKVLRHPTKTALLSLAVLYAAVYCTLWILNLGWRGRWHWNYAVALHPALAYVIPKGDWTSPTDPPHWVQEIYDAPWMGDFDVPHLSPRVYSFTSSYHLASPVILKLHIISTVSTESRQKRHLIRRLSPLFTIPSPYRHLIELKFVLGHAYRADGSVDDAVEAALAEEQDSYGDLLRLNLTHGENLRGGKILDWIRAVGTGLDGGREAWWLVKADDDAVLNLPNFLDALLALDPKQPVYLGTSLNRWPSYHYHFTGLVTGFSWPPLQTLSAGIGEMPREEIETWWDDDVLTGELLFCLPPAPQCRGPLDTLPPYCDPRRPPPWGWRCPPSSPDPRTGLIRHDFLRRMGDKYVWFIKGDLARHSYWFKPLEGYEAEWRERIQGKIWTPPGWLKRYADKAR
ncbi:hypothetical protein P7C73_g4576, partial [Tremellales sp. Uapishka_1]